MLVIFDSRDSSNLLISIGVPLLPLTMSLWGFSRWRATLRREGNAPNSVVVYPLVTGFIFLTFAWFFWWNSWRLEHDYSAGRTRTVEGRVADYQVTPDGKDVSFAVSGRRFDVPCCDPRPIYRGTPNSGLSRELLREGMYVRLTYLYDGEIVRIETPNTLGLADVSRISLAVAALEV